MCQIIIDKHLPLNAVLCNQFNLNLSKNNLGINSCINSVNKALFAGFPFCHSHSIFIDTKHKPKFIYFDPYQTYVKAIQTSYHGTFTTTAR